MFPVNILFSSCFVFSSSFSSCLCFDFYKFNNNTIHCQIKEGTSKNKTTLKIIKTCEKEKEKENMKIKERIEKIKTVLGSDGE